MTGNDLLIIQFGQGGKRNAEGLEHSLIKGPSLTASQKLCSIFFCVDLKGNKMLVKNNKRCSAA